MQLSVNSYLAVKVKFSIFTVLETVEKPLRKQFQEIYLVTAFLIK